MKCVTKKGVKCVIKEYCVKSVVNKGVLCEECYKQGSAV